MSPPPPYTYVSTMHTHCINIHTDTLYAHTVHIHSSHLCQLLAVHFRTLNISLNSSSGKQCCCPPCYRNVGASCATSHPDTFLDTFIYLVCLFSVYPCGTSPDRCQPLGAEDCTVPAIRHWHIPNMCSKCTVVTPTPLGLMCTTHTTHTLWIC